MVVAESSYSLENWQNVEAQLKATVDSQQSDLLISLDGPVSVGKGWIAQKLADIFGYHQISNGNVVRAYTWFFFHHCFPTALEDGSFAKYVSEEIKVKEITVKGQDVVSLEFRGKSIDLNPNGQDLDRGLRSPEIEEIVSTISPLVSVVEKIRARVRSRAQKALETKQPFLVEGRDNYKTFEVFPQALKIYITASDEVLIKRALNREEKKRRAKGLPAMTEADIEALIDSVRQRNKNDMHQPYGFGKLLTLEEANDTPNYHVVDTTEFSKEESLYAVVLLQLLWAGITPDLEVTQQPMYQPHLL